MNIFLTALSLSFFSLDTVAAPLTPDELLTTYDTVSALNPQKELPCDFLKNDLERPIFVFDGANGFCPRYFYLNAHDQNHPQSLLERMTETPRTDANGKTLDGINDLLKKETAIKNCLLIKHVLERHQRLDSDSLSKIQGSLHYYSKSGDSEAVACAKQTPVTASIQVIAYSMGSEAALEFAKGLQTESRGIQNLLSMDPVGRKMKWISGVILTTDDPDFEKPANVGKWTNFFQKEDRYSLLDTSLAHFGIRGSAVTGADLNHQILPEDFATEEKRKHGHVQILNQPEVSKAIQEQLSPH